MRRNAFCFLFGIFLPVILRQPMAAFSAITISIPGQSGQRGNTVEIPINASGINLSDSVIAYQVKVAFSSTVIQSVGATSTATMTERWGSPVVGSKTDTVRIAGYTTNQPSRRMVDDAGILVKMQFLVVGAPGSITVMSILEAKLYNPSGEMGVTIIPTANFSVSGNATPVTKDITLYPNWNLISFPVIPNTSTLPEVLGGVPVVYVSAYFSGEGHKTWDSNRNPLFNDLKKLDGLHGYWMKLNAASNQVLHIIGSPITVSTPIPFYGGWNLVGYLPGSNDVISHSLQSINPNYIYIQGYYASSGQYKTWDRNRNPIFNDLIYLSPLFGYWIKMDSAKTLVYPSSGYLLSKASASSRINTSEMQSPPTICDFWSYQPELYKLGDRIHVYDNNRVLCGDTVVTSLGGFLVHVSGDDPSTTIVDEGADNGEVLRFTINNDSTQVLGTSANYDSVIITGESAKWENMGSKRVKLKKISTGIQSRGKNAMIPEDILFVRNYPNPFNAETQIQYQICQPSEVTLAVLDCRGRMIRELVKNRLQNPGMYSFQWNGEDRFSQKVASGVYFCSLRMGAIHQISKMILLY